MKKAHLATVVIGLSIWISAFAGPREQAYRLHNRLTGVPPVESVLNQMQLLIQNNDPEGAAKIAMANPYFYNLILKNWVKKWSNSEQTNRAPLNDLVATVIGMVRDNTPFDQILYGDILYIGGPNSGVTTPYAPDSNDHYMELENQNVDLKANLVVRAQAAMNGIADSAGIMTTRAYGEAFYSAGTNRRVTRYTFMNFLCRDFEALHDITIADVYVRKDVDRKPGGDSRTFRNKCVGCHAGQDSLGGAFAYFDYVDGQLQYTPGTVATKINLNNNFNDGHAVTSDYWENLWSQGQNAVLGWNGTHFGYGVRAFGRYLSSTNAFGQCMAEKVFDLVCLKKPTKQTDIDSVAFLASSFEAGGQYNMQDLISKTSVLCLGE